MILPRTGAKTSHFLEFVPCIVIPDYSCQAIKLRWSRNKSRDLTVIQRGIRKIGKCIHGIRDGTATREAGFAEFFARHEVLGKKTVSLWAEMTKFRTRDYREKKRERGIGTPFPDPVICAAHTQTISGRDVLYGNNTIHHRSTKKNRSWKSDNIRL